MLEGKWEATPQPQENMLSPLCETFFFVFSTFSLANMVSISATYMVQSFLNYSLADRGIAARYLASLSRYPYCGVSNKFMEYSIPLVNKGN